MAEILKGSEVIQALNERMINDVKALRQIGIVPALCTLRVGENPDDIAYERSAVKKCQQVGVDCKSIVLPSDITQEEFDKKLQSMNNDDSIHGILMFRPLPPQLDNERARQMLAPEKDIDGCTDGSLAMVFANTPLGFYPCTAHAVMEILHHYNIPVEGKKAVIIGRSLVVGRPVAMLLMSENATVTICHTKTKGIEEIARGADIIVSCAGKLRLIDEKWLRPGQTVIDVGINFDESTGKIAGDVDFEKAQEIVAAISPVPGGVGGVTTAILVSHVIEAAIRKARK